MDNGALAQKPYLTFFESDTAEYDVIVDQSSSAPNLKEATWGAIQPLLPIVGPTMGPEEMALVLEYSPMPESFLEKFKALQAKKAEQPPPPDPEMMKVEAMKQVKGAELEMRKQEAAVEMQVEQQKVAAQLDLERQKAAAQIQLEREKAAAALMLEQQKAVMEQEKNAMALAMDRERMAFDQERSRSETSMKHKAMKHELILKTGLARSEMKKAADSEGAGEMDDTEDEDLFGNKAVADALAQMSRALTQMAQANAESQRMMAEGIAALGSELSQAMSKPKQIVRGPDGRAIGVQ